LLSLHKKARIVRMTGGTIAHFEHLQPYARGFARKLADRTARLPPPD
jgi:hypothetical protein